MICDLWTGIKYTHYAFAAVTIEKLYYWSSYE